MDAEDTFGQWMKKRRKQLDLTQEELAGLVSCSPVMIKKIEANQRRPSKQMVDGLARVLQIAPADLTSFLAAARGVLPEWSEHAPQLPSLFAAQIPLLPSISLVKRPVEIATVCNLLRQPDVRLLTLTGPGGVGKTHLATQAARELQHEFVDGAHLIDLSPVFQPELLLTTIAIGLGLAAPDENTARQRLSGYFRDKQALLVLDNFEQILEAAPRLASWFTATTGLKILVTSRARLRLSMEYEYPVPPMTLPNLRSLPMPEEILAQSPAVELFTLRVQATQPSFRLTSENAAAVAEMCTLLDGLPLAIELAAARCNLLAPSSLLEHLHQFHPLRLLTVGPQDLPARQQTLQRTIDWSYSLLNEEERRLFERLGVFMGGATLEAIEALCDDDNKLQLLDNLQALMHHNLIWRSELPGEAPRFQMLVIFREYALEHLDQRGELKMFRHKHAFYFESWVTGIIPELRTSRQIAAVHRMGIDLDNLRTALDWCCSDPTDLEIGMRLAGRLWEFWMLHGDHEEGQAWILRLLAAFGNATPTIWQGHMLNGIGVLANESGKDPTNYYEQSLAIFRTLGDRYGEAWVLNHLGQVPMGAGTRPYEQCRAYLEESLRLFSELNAGWNSAWVFHNLANLALYSGDFALAEANIQKCLRSFAQVGDPRGVALAHFFCGKLAQQRGDAPAAIQAFREAMHLFRKSAASPNRGAWVNIPLGNLLLQTGDAAAAAPCFLESLQLFKHRGDFNLGVACSLIGLARVAVKKNRPEQAAVMLGAASALFKPPAADGGKFAHDDDLPIEQAMRERLGQVKFDRMWRETQQTPVEPQIRQRLGQAQFERLWQEGQQAPARVIKLIDEGNFETGEEAQGAGEQTRDGL